MSRGAAAVPGLGLLPVDTVFAPNKTTRLVRGQIRNPGFIAGARDAVCDGYEIHLGHGVSGGAAPFCELRAAGEVTTLDGAVSEDGLTIGTYVHGLFRNEPLRDALLSSLAARKGSDFTPIAVVDDAYSCLSEWLRSSLDVNELLAQCGIDHLSRQGASARVEFRRPGDRSESAEAQRR